ARLRVATELRRHLLVRRTLEVEAQRVRLELRQTRAEREDEALELLRRDYADRGVVDCRAREGVAQRAFAIGILAGRRMAERDVRVQRCVLEARRRFERRDGLLRAAALTLA